MDKSKNYVLKNRSAGMVCYSIPEMNGLRREFMPGESKTVTYEEIEKLAFLPGGRTLIESFLQIIDEEVTEHLNIDTQPEYYMSEEQIADLIKNGSMDAFLDALDYAPTGVMDLIKQFAVALPMTDTQKIRALKDKTGFNVEAALKNLEAEKAEDAAFVETPKKGAATTTSTKTATSGRRTSSTYKTTNTTTESKYKVVSQEEK